jgi:hypothetical protein
MRINRREVLTGVVPLTSACLSKRPKSGRSATRNLEKESPTPQRVSEFYNKIYTEMDEDVIKSEAKEVQYDELIDISPGSPVRVVGDIGDKSTTSGGLTGYTILQGRSGNWVSIVTKNPDLEVFQGIEIYGLMQGKREYTINGEKQILPEIAVADEEILYKYDTPADGINTYAHEFVSGPANFMMFKGRIENFGGDSVDQVTITYKLFGEDDIRHGSVFTNVNDVDPGTVVPFDTTYYEGPDPRFYTINVETTEYIG